MKDDDLAGLADLIESQQSTPWRQAKARAKRWLLKVAAVAGGVLVLGLLAGSQSGLPRWLLLASPVLAVLVAIVGHSLWLRYDSSRAIPPVEDDAEPYEGGQPAWPDLATPHVATQREPTALPATAAKVYPFPAAPARQLYTQPIHRQEDTDGDD